MKTIQWRWKKQYQRKGVVYEWKDHSDVRDDEVKTTLLNFNDNDQHFEYRESPVTPKPKAAASA